MLARFVSLLTVFFCLVAGLQPALGKERVNIHDIRLWRAPDSTRLVFDMDKATEHTMQVLQNPDRVVLNVADAAMLANPAKIGFQGTPVASLRASAQANGELRIELMLSAKVTARSFFLKKNPPMDDRLVLDLIDAAPATDTPMEEADDIESILNENAARKPATSMPVATSVPSAAVSKTAPAATAASVKPVELPKMVAVPTDTRRRQLIIAIDAGHGGEDPGAMGPAGIREKDVVLQISKKLLENFNRQPGYRAMLTRKSDYYVGLVQRRDIARKANADLFVAIHADAFTRPQANGSSVYALSSRGATSASAQFLADKENQSDLVGGVSLDDKDAVLSSVLVDLSMTYKMESSLEVGASVLRKMANISRLHSNKVEQAAFAVLKTPDIPSILVETGFISNHTEAKKLSSSAYQQKMADAIYMGINEYFIRKAPEGTYFSRQQASVSTPVTAATKPSSSWSSPEITHKVSRGETLSGIAHQYGMSMKTLVDYNHLSSSEVRIGQQLKIPPRR